MGRDKWNPNLGREEATEEAVEQGFWRNSVSIQLLRSQVKTGLLALPPRLTYKILLPATVLASPSPPHHFYYYISDPMRISLGEKNMLSASETNSNNHFALEGKAQLNLRIASLPSQEKETKNKRQQGASCQSVNPISKEDASTWHWAVSSQPDSLHHRMAMWFSELTAAKQSLSD